MITIKQNTVMIYEYLANPAQQQKVAHLVQQKHV
jgi:hypothetical protein